MHYTNTNILLDIHAPEPQLCIPLRQGDTGRILSIRLMDRGRPYPIGPDCTAVFTARKPDGTVLFNPCQLLGERILYPLTAQTTAAPGLLEAEVRLYGDNAFLLTSPRLHLLVQPAIYDDDQESQDEQSALTALISQTRSLNETVEEKLSAGAFVPSFSVGSVQTLPSGSLATVELTGSGAEPVLHFGIPLGSGGEGAVITDTALSASSTRPVQNHVIKAALDRKADKAESEAALAAKADAAETAAALDTKADAAETQAALDRKVDKIAGKGLSSCDFTAEEKEKLAGIAQNANRYQLPDAGVTAEKLAAGAVSRVYTATLGTNWSGTEAPYSQTIAVPGLPGSDRILADLMVTEDWEAEEEAYAAITKLEAAAGLLTAYAREKTETPLHLKLLVVHGSGLGSGGSTGSGGDAGGGPITSEGLTLIDTETGQAHTLYVSGGKLSLA